MKKGVEKDIEPFSNCSKTTPICVCAPLTNVVQALNRCAKVLASFEYIESVSGLVTGQKSET